MDELQFYMSLIGQQCADFNFGRADALIRQSCQINSLSLIFIFEYNVYGGSMVSRWDFDDKTKFLSTTCQLKMDEFVINDSLGHVHDNAIKFHDELSMIYRWLVAGYEQLPTQNCKCAETIKIFLNSIFI